MRYSTHRSKYLRYIIEVTVFETEVINKIRIPDIVRIIRDFEIINNHDKTYGREKQNDVGAKVFEA